MEKILRCFRKASAVNKDCKFCRGLYDGSLRVQATELINGSLIGCPACVLLYQTISPTDLSDPRIDLVHIRLFSDSHVSQTFDPKSGAMSRHLCAEEGFSKGGWFASSLHTFTPPHAPVERSVELFSLKGNPSYWPRIVSARHVAAVADSSECLEGIRTWVSDCNRKHASCKKISSGVLPDRVIFIGSGSDPRLIEPKGALGRYIALSHRWGGQLPMQLNKDTINAFKHSIPFARFPKSFQDAIRICRALAVEYIWIDSICIMQDSAEDWETQGSKMDQVYTNCWLAIAADAAMNCHAGFINTTERQELRRKTRQLVCYGPGGEREEVFARPSRKFGSLGGFGRHYESWEPEDIQPSQKSIQQGSYLLRRGWVFQETFLPRRVLHFLPDEVTWRCASASRCECQIRPHDKVPHSADTEEPRQIDIENLKEFWREIIEQYTRRQLTYNSDRLAALAGLASRAHLGNPDTEYYAGLWSDNLPSTLLWVVSWSIESERESGYTSDRIEPPIAPTWSWASVTGQIDFHFWKRSYGRGKWANSAPDLTDIHIHCPPSGENKYGTVKDGRLTALGYICQVNISLTGGSRWHFPCKMECRIQDGTSRKSIGYFYPDTEIVRDSLEASSEAVNSLMVVSLYESRLFLVLRQVEDGQSVFNRIGVIHCEEKDKIVLADWGFKERFTIV
ncbi:HET-domain-containing protein [Hypoxylon sp. EC38]|nr:HET-domain-containing protein [Hypoxylon sp. EC38]